MKLRSALRGVLDSRLLFPAAVITAIAVLGILTGLMVVRLPTAAWALFGIIMGLALLLAPAHIRIGAAILAAVGSRLIVATGLAPGLLNFLHFPLALGVALISAFDSSRRSPARRPLEIGLLGLLALSMLSWMVNGGELLRPLLDWLVLVEPFLIVYAIINMPLEAGGMKFLRALAFAIVIGQLPVMAWQALRVGISDSMQGFFKGMGAGAHVAGAVCLTGALILIARAVTSGNTGKRIAWLAGSAALFAATVLADAKQVIIPFLPALVLLLVAAMRLRLSTVIAAVPLLTVGVLGAFSYYRPLQVALDWTLISKGLRGKAEAFSVVAHRLSEVWSGWLVGLGPGNSISRVAQMGLEAFVKSDSPVAALNLGPAATTRELFNLTASSRLFSASSVWSGVSSWLGILGDLGLAGLALFGWMYWVLWRNIRTRAGWEAGAAKAILLMTLLLGFLYSWLEEPGFTLVAALAVGLGLNMSEHAQQSGGKEPHAQ